MVLGPMTTPPPVPDTLEVLLDPAWLTAALGTRFPGIQVTRVIPGPVVERLSTNARFTIECERGLPAGLVPTLCAKGYFGEQGRHIAHIGEPEARFYATLAETTGVHTLKSVYADVHPETRHGVVITEDVVAAGGEFLDALSRTPPSRPRRASRSSRDCTPQPGPRPTRRPSPGSHPVSRRTSPTEASTTSRPTSRDRSGSTSPPRSPTRSDSSRRCVRWRRAGDGPGWSVIHGDAHVGNLFLDAHGAPGLVDWQLVQRGPLGHRRRLPRRLRARHARPRADGA